MCLSDLSGDLNVIFHPSVFVKYLRDPLRIEFGTPIKSLSSLSDWDGISLVILGWIFGRNEPYVFTFWPLGRENEIKEYMVLAQIISTKKVLIQELNNKFPGWDQILLNRPDIIQKGNWVYYVPVNLDNFFL